MILVIFLVIGIAGCNTGELQKANSENSELLSKVNQLEQSSIALNNKNTLLETQNKHLNSNPTTKKESVPTTSTLVNPDVIESKINGEFKGWEGETVFKLMNGQIWQQASYNYTYHYAYMPSVIIYRSGSVYQRRVEGVNETISVKRLNRRANS